MGPSSKDVCVCLQRGEGPDGSHAVLGGRGRSWLDPGSGTVVDRLAARTRTRRRRHAARGCRGGFLAGLIVGRVGLRRADVLKDNNLKSGLFSKHT